MAGEHGMEGGAHRETGDQDDGLQLRKGSMRRCDGEWPARRRASRGNSRGGDERAEGDSCDGQPREEAHSAMHGARAGRGGMLDGVNTSNTSGRKGPHRRSRDEMGVGRGVAVGGEAGGFTLLLFVSFLALFPLGCSGQKAIEYTSQEFLTEDCTHATNECARLMFSLRETCGPAKAGSNPVSFLGPVGAGNCPVWLQRSIDEACLACSQVYCTERKRTQEQNYFLNGVQETFTSVDTTDWKGPLTGCGGVQCSLAQCTINWKVRFRYTDNRCLVNPVEVIEEAISDDVFVKGQDRASLTCKPSSCAPVLPGSNGTALFWETTVCMNEVNRPSKSDGKLMAPKGAFWTKKYYKSPGGGANCTGKDVALVHLKLHGQCIPDLDPFKPVTAPPSRWTSFVCALGEVRAFTDDLCKKPLVAGANKTEVKTKVPLSEELCEAHAVNMSAGQSVINQERCTSYTILTYYADDKCLTEPLLRLVKDSKAVNPGSTCTPTLCAKHSVFSGQETGHYFVTDCPDVLPATPGTPEGGKGTYLVEKSWFKNDCTPAENPNIMYARIQDKCVSDIISGDGRYFKVDTNAKTITQYPSGDKTCSKPFQVNSFADKLYYPSTSSSKASGPYCTQDVMCQGVSTPFTVGGVCEPRWTTVQVYAN